MPEIESGKSDDTGSPPLWRTYALACMILATLAMNAILGKSLWDELYLASGVAEVVIAEPYNNIVVVESKSSMFHPLQPWQIDEAKQASTLLSAGVIIQDGFILVPSSAATESRMVRVRRLDTGALHNARVWSIAGDLGLALLRLDTQAWKGFGRPEDVQIRLETGLNIPPLGSSVLVAGLGTESELQNVIKVQTRVSKITSLSFGISGSRYAAPPVPAFSLYPPPDQSLTDFGIVVSASSGQTVGFLSAGGDVLPAGLVASFVESARSGESWPGLPSAGLLVRTMQSPSMRRFWGLHDTDVGVQVRGIAPDSALRDLVKKGDVLMSVQGVTVHANGNVDLGNGTAMGNVPWEALVASHNYGAPVKFKFCQASLFLETHRLSEPRSCSLFEVDANPRPPLPLVPRLVDRTPLKQPPYLIIGGLVFTVYSESLALLSQVDAEVGPVPPSINVQVDHRWRTNKFEEPIVLMKTLEHSVNKQFEGTDGMRLLKLFNNEPVANMSQLTSSIGNALESNTDFLTFAFEPLGLNAYDDSARGSGDPDVVLKTSLLGGVDRSLMAKHGIAQPASAELMPIYASRMPRRFVNAPSTTSIQSQGVIAANSANTKSSKTDAADSKKGLDSQLKIVPKVPWDNVVKITLYGVERDLAVPWKKISSGQATCTGIILDVEAKIILTNSHCVRGTSRVELTREKYPYPATARIIEFARDIDVAWITTDEQAFWSDSKLKPKVEMSKGMPALSSAVFTVGYPTGGDSVTINAGIVSRIDGRVYAQELQYRNAPDNTLYYLVDAAINPGNSGGPVFNNEAELVGLSFAKFSMQREGLVIPNLYLKNFIQAVQSTDAKRWVGEPQIGIITSTIMNPSHKAFLKLEDHQSGVQVRSVAPTSLLNKKVHKGDILVSIDGLPIQGDGRVVVRNTMGQAIAVPYDTLVSQKPPGEQSAMQFLRISPSSGQRSSFNISEIFRPIAPLVPRFDDAPLSIKGREHFAAKESYFVQCGLIWGVLSSPIISDKTPWSVRQYALNRWRDPNSSDLVVLMGSFQNFANIHYDTSTMRVLDTFDGQSVANLKHFVQMASIAENRSTADSNDKEAMHYTFKGLVDLDMAGLVDDPDMVLPKALCKEADTNLLKQNNIPSRVSQDLQKTFDDASKIGATHKASEDRSSLISLTLTGRVHPNVWRSKQHQADMLTPGMR